MGKIIRLTFVKEGVSAQAELLFDKAPATAQMIWDILATPMENMAIHAMFTGRELSLWRTERKDG